MVESVSESHILIQNSYFMLYSSLMSAADALVADRHILVA